jgi:hypothetical protein
MWFNSMSDINLIFIKFIFFRRWKGVLFVFRNSEKSKDFALIIQLNQLLFSQIK